MAAGRSSASSPRASRSLGTHAVAVVFAAIAAAGSPAARGDDVAAAGKPADDDAAIARAWRALRVVDCARCHGRRYDGLAAPSIVAYAATQSPQQFARIVLDGDPSRGMPGYRGNPLVVENLDAIHRYFVARASGEIGGDYRAPGPAVDR